MLTAACDEASVSLGIFRMKLAGEGGEQSAPLARVATDTVTESPGTNVNTSAEGARKSRIAISLLVQLGDVNPTVS